MKLPLTITVIFYLFLFTDSYAQAPFAPTWKEDKVEFRFAKMAIYDKAQKKKPENFVDSKINITTLADNFWSLTVDVSNTLYIKDVYIEEYKYERKGGMIIFTLTGVKDKEVILISLYYYDYSDKPEKVFIGYSKDDKAPLKTYVASELKD